MLYRKAYKIMGLFNRKKKEEVEFNYDEMMAAAKLHNIFDGCKLYNVFKTGCKFVSYQYESTNEETELIGVYNKYDKLIVLLKYNLEQKILFDYLLQCGRRLDYIFEKIEVLPLTIEAKDEILLSNYSNSEILKYIKKINVGGLYLECSINKTLNNK